MSKPDNLGPGPLFSIITDHRDSNRRHESAFGSDPRSSLATAIEKARGGKAMRRQIAHSARATKLGGTLGTVGISASGV